MNTNTTVITVTKNHQVITLTESGEYEVRLEKEGSEVEIRGAWRVRKNDQLKIALRIVHAASHTHSRTLLRAVAQDTAQVTLNGTIVVEPGASQTNAFLTENILLLSPSAVAHAVPNLEIHTDEVKCSHAATVSPIPESQIFYLQSRGISRERAEDLVVDGFLALE